MIDSDPAYVLSIGKCIGSFFDRLKKLNGGYDSLINKYPDSVRGRDFITSLNILEDQFEKSNSDKAHDFNGWVGQNLPYSLGILAESEVNSTVLSKEDFPDKRQVNQGYTLGNYIKEKLPYTCAFLSVGKQDRNKLIETLKVFHTRKMADLGTSELYDFESGEGKYGSPQRDYDQYYLKLVDTLTQELEAKAGSSIE